MGPQAGVPSIIARRLCHSLQVPAGRDVTEPAEPLPSRDRLVSAIVEFLGGRDLLTLDDVRVALAREIDEAGADAVFALKERLTSDHGWGFYARDPLAHRIHLLLADRFLQPDSRLAGIEHLASVNGNPLILFANHLSYADANIIQVLLERSGEASVARRLTAIAGPKVFSSVERRFSSLCFGTIKVPQSAEVSSGEAVMRVREVARAARQSIDAASERLIAGDVLVVFGEGTRSRSGGMQRMLPGVARYLDLPGTLILPIGLVGSEALFPVGYDSIRPARVAIQLGRPLKADALVARVGGSRRHAMDAIGLVIARLLPGAYRGVYGDEAGYTRAVDALEAISDS
jgi:1-acyl-sn-glycerol-3-phosphate acyltransferase